MQTLNRIRAALLAGLTAAFLAAPAAAATIPNSAIEPVQQGDITYISGGIGLDEVTALKAEGKSYDLAVSSSDRTGHYMPGTNITITRKGGDKVLHAEDAGPLFYAKLPAGQYIVDVTNGSERQKHAVEITSGARQNLHLLWKAE